MIQDNDVQYQFSYLGFDHLASHITCIREPVLIAGEQLAESAISAIDLVIKQNRFPVLSLSGNAIILEKFLPDILKHFDPEQFFVLSADLAGDYSNQKNIEHWPTCLLFQQSAVVDYRKTFKKNYRISALMRQARLHRLMLWQAIKPVVRDQDVVVANHVVENNVPTNVRESAEAMSWLKDLPWYSKAEFFDLGNHMDSNFAYMSIDHPAYQACVNITNESWAEHIPISISEKTWKAYASACMVINYGSSRVPEVLKNLGFAIWEEYDPCLNYQDKIHKIVELFQRDDIEDLYNKNVDMITHNQQLATSWHFARKLAMPAVEKIQALL